MGGNFKLRALNLLSYRSTRGLPSDENVSRSFCNNNFRAFEPSGTEKTMNNFNLIEPLYVNIAINLNSGFNPQFKEEPFKY